MIGEVEDYLRGLGWVADAGARARDEGHVFHVECFVVPREGREPSVKTIEQAARHAPTLTGGCWTWSLYRCQPCRPRWNHPAAVTQALHREARGDHGNQTRNLHGPQRCNGQLRGVFYTSATVSIKHIPASEAYYDGKRAKGKRAHPGCAGPRPPTRQHALGRALRPTKNNRPHTCSPLDQRTRTTDKVSSPEHPTPTTERTGGGATARVVNTIQAVPLRGPVAQAD